MYECRRATLKWFVQHTSYYIVAVFGCLLFLIYYSVSWLDCEAVSSPTTAQGTTRQTSRFLLICLLFFRKSTSLSLGKSSSSCWALRTNLDRNPSKGLLKSDQIDRCWLFWGINREVNTSYLCEIPEEGERVLTIVCLIRTLICS